MMDASSRKVRLAGIGLVLAVLGAFALTGAFYNRAFSNPAEVTVETARVGLIMMPGNKVKMRGVEIGRVSQVEADGDRAKLVIQLDRGALADIPSDVDAEIRASTVFGAKYVELVAPGTSDGQHLADGDTIEATGVTTEVNTLFESLDRVLSSVDVTGLNTTLSVLARALSGRGEQIAETAAQADAYLTRLEPLLPQLRRTLVQIADISDLASDISPALVRILRNATVTSGTVVTQEKALARLLTDLSLLGTTGARVLGLNSQAIAELVHGLRLPTSTLRAYSVELPCFIQGAEVTHQIMTKVFGQVNSGLRAELSVRSGLPKYVYPRDLPTLERGGAAACHSLPSVPTSQIPVPEVGAPQ